VKILCCLDGIKKIEAERDCSQKKKMKRRDFLEKTAATTAVLGLGLSLVVLNLNVKKLTILHTNDVHSHHIDPFLPTIREIQIWAVLREELNPK
jgi:hypothetical protein